MNTIICEDPLDLSRVATEWCRNKVQQYKARSLFVPAGRTPIALYKLWTQERPEFLNDLELLQVDDVLGNEKNGIFKEFFEEHLSAYQHQLRFIEHGDACADLAILGLGLNGHVAFHEPGIDREFFSGCVKLDDSTCDTLGISHGTWGVTYGAGAFIRSKSILITVTGASKKSVLQKLLAMDPALPASALLNHADVTILADRDAFPLGLDGKQKITRSFESHGAA